jgi:hypothetical protein
MRAYHKQVGPRGEFVRLRIVVGHTYESLHEAGELMMTAGEFYMLMQGKIIPEYEPDEDGEDGITPKDAYSSWNRNDTLQILQAGLAFIGEQKEVTDA